MVVGTQVQVGGGTVARHEGLSFGGADMLPADEGEPAQVIITVWDRNPGERDFKLSIGQSFEFSGQTWRLDEIDNRSHRWYATLTRVA
jgi:Family of unknown function (DUF6406)